MQYGVLRRKEDDLNACFFIKKDGDGIEPKQRALKETVRRNTHYPYTEYTHVEELGEKVEKVFTELLERLFPQTGLSILELERLAQRAFLHSRCHVYIRNEANFEVLNTFLDDVHTRYLVITGESGMGKSALVANWLNDHREDDRFCTIYHFIGNSGAEGDYNRILSCLTDEIYDLYDLPKPDDKMQQSGQDRREPKEILQELMMRIAGKKPLLIVLDGINQLAEREGEEPKLLNWLPAVPDGCKMLFSTLEDDETMATFRRRAYPVFRLEPLDQAQQRELIANYMHRYGKKLTPEQIARIADDPENRNTLVLRTLLDELVCFGVHEELDARIDYYLAAENIEDFFQRVLQRAEEDYGREVVRDTLALIAVSHEGMSETEMLDMAHILPLRWSAFYCAFAAHFTVKNGLVNFSHRYLYAAAAARYLDTQSETAFRQRVIDYFTNSGEFATREEKSEETRAWSELAHQYYSACLNKELHALLLRPEVFDYFYEKNIERMVSLWQQLRADVSGGFSLNDYLADEYENPAPWYYFKVGYFSNEYFQEFDTAEKAYEKALILFRRQATENPEAFESKVAMILNNLGSLHHDLKNYTSAEKKYREALQIRRRLAAKNPETFESDVAQTLNNLGILHCDLKNYASAEKEYREALEIQRRLVAKNPEAFEPDVAATLNNLGNLHCKLLDYTSAEKEYRVALEIRRRLTTKHPEVFEPDVAMTLNNLGILHYNLQDYASAEKGYREALEIRRRLAAKNPEALESEVANTLNGLGALHCDLQDYASAEKEFREALEIRRRLAAKNPKVFESEVAETLNNLGILHANLQDYASAEKEIREALEIRRRLAAKNPEVFESEVAETLNNLGILHANLQDYASAEKEIREALEIRRRLAATNSEAFDSDMATVLSNIGVTHYYLQNYISAETDFREALDIYRCLAKKHPEAFDSKVASMLSKLEILHKCVAGNATNDSQSRE